MLDVEDVFLLWLVQSCIVKGFVRQWKSTSIKYQTSGLEWPIKKCSCDRAMCVSIMYSVNLIVHVII